jgi:hypothetical protein
LVVWQFFFGHAVYMDLFLKWKTKEKMATGLLFCMKSCDKSSVDRRRLSARDAAQQKATD